MNSDYITKGYCREFKAQDILLMGRSTPRKFLKFCISLKHPKVTTLEGVRLQVPLSLSQFVLFLSKNALSFPKLPFYFAGIALLFSIITLLFSRSVFFFPRIVALFLISALLFSSCNPDLIEWIINRGIFYNWVEVPLISAVTFKRYFNLFHIKFYDMTVTENCMA